MSETAFPEPDVTVPEYEPTELRERIEAGEDVYVLDVRASGEYEEWRIDGESVESENVPYFELIEGVDEETLELLPDDREVVVVCAKGGASDYIAGLLVEAGVDAAHLVDGMNGWARIYETTELDAGDATVLQYRRPSSGCLAYLVVDGNEATVVDPLRAFAERYVEDAEAYGADLVYAIDTHVHADHVSGVRELAREYGVTPVVPAAAEDRGIDYDLEYEAIADGEVLEVGDTEIEAMHTPGHTTGMTSYRVNELLFTGDGLFTESVARPDLEDGDDGAPEAASMLYDTLQDVVLVLPDETVVAPAHFSDAATPASDGSYTATLGTLRESMAALSMDREAFVDLILADMPPRPGNYEEIIGTNLGVQDTDDDEAFRLELGPNNCAASQDALTSD